MQESVPQANCTSFVDLKSVVEPVRCGHDLQSTVTFQPTTAPSRDTLVAAWAHLLRCYTGDDAPVFRVDDGIIRYHLDDGRREKVEPIEDESGRSLPTGITFASVRFSMCLA